MKHKGNDITIKKNRIEDEIIERIDRQRIEKLKPKVDASQVPRVGQGLN